MKIPAQYNEIGKVIPASSTICQIHHVVGEGRIQTTNNLVRLHRQASADRWVNCLQARPESIDGETQGIG